MDPSIQIIVTLGPKSVNVAIPINYSGFRSLFHYPNITPIYSLYPLYNSYIPYSIVFRLIGSLGRCLSSRCLLARTVSGVDCPKLFRSVLVIPFKIVTHCSRMEPCACKWPNKFILARWRRGSLPARSSKEKLKCKRAVMLNPRAWSERVHIAVAPSSETLPKIGEGGGWGRSSFCGPPQRRPYCGFWKSPLEDGSGVLDRNEVDALLHAPQLLCLASGQRNDRRVAILLLAGF